MTGRNFHEAASQMRDLAAKGHDEWEDDAFSFRKPPPENRKHVAECINGDNVRRPVLPIALAIFLLAAFGSFAFAQSSSDAPQTAPVAPQTAPVAPHTPPVDILCGARTWKTPEEALSALERNTFSRTVEQDKFCLQQALKLAKFVMSDASDDILKRYLDYQCPLPPFCGPLRYEAMGHYVLRGRHVLPMLVRAIEEDQSNALIRENASIAIGLILNLHTVDTAQYLRDQGDQVEPGARRNLYEAATHMLEFATKGRDECDRQNGYMPPPEKAR